MLKCALLSPGLALRADTKEAARLSGGFNLLPYIQKVDLYESIWDNTISGSIDILENIGLPEYLPIVGVETIGIVFQVDANDPNTAPTTFARTFRVVGLKNQTFPRHDWRMYTLVLVTHEFVQSVSGRICRAFRDTTCEDAVTNILRKDLDVETSRVDVEPTFGVMVDITVPNYTPLQAVNFFTILAKTEDNKNSNFLFYETMAGKVNNVPLSNGVFHFRSAASLIKSGRDLDANNELVTYQMDSGAITTIDTITVNDIMTAGMRLHQNQGFDLLFDIGSGMLRSQMIHLDFLARQIGAKVANNAVDSRYTETFDSTTHLDNYPVYPRNFDKSVDKNVRIFTVPSNQWSSKSKYVLSLEDQPIQRLHESIVLRNRQLKELRHVEALLDVPGNPKISAGSVVRVNYPSSRVLLGNGNLSMTDSQQPGPTPYYSGRHLVTAVHHILLTKSPGSMEYRMNLQVNRDSFGAPLIGTPDA